MKRLLAVAALLVAQPLLAAEPVTGRWITAEKDAVIAIGSCASWGGIPSADPNPTDAVGAPQILEGTTVVTIPGCPANPYNFLGTVLQFATFGTDLSRLSTYFHHATRRQTLDYLCLEPQDFKSIFDHAL